MGIQRTIHRFGGWYMRTTRQLTNVHMDAYMRTYTDTDSKYYSYYSVRQDPGNAYNSKLLFGTSRSGEGVQIFVTTGPYLLSHGGAKRDPLFSHPVTVVDLLYVKIRGRRTNLNYTRIHTQSRWD